ncbi:hypothetical protein [Sulfurovum sp.]|uniref:hypothetical protein n=1 Tax=Sulfurovum sp. TaxID=1969726 RepID=UPI00260CB946|nr:hypothetical protein [Sulfurovum sp.]
MGSEKFVPNGKRFIDNLAPNVSPAYLGNVASGRTVTLSGDGKIDVPINATLGDEERKLADSVDADWTDNGDNTYTGSTVNGNISGVSTTTSGTLAITITLSDATDGDVNGYTENGTYTFEKTVSSSLVLVGTGFSGTVSVDSIKKIQDVQGSILYYDVTQKKHVRPTLPLSTTYQLKDLTFNNLAVLWDKTFTPEDIAKIDVKPELLVSWGLGNDAGLSIGVKGTNDKYYACSESFDQYLYEIGGIGVEHNPSIFPDDGHYTHTGGAEWDILNVQGGYRLTITSLGDTPQGTRVISNLASTPTSGNMCRFSVKTKIINGKSRTYRWLHNGYIRLLYINGIVSTWGDALIDKGKYKIIGYQNSNGTINCSQYFDTKDGDGVTVGSVIEFTNFSFIELNDNVLPIEGTHTRSTNSQYGLQTLGFELSDAGVPTAFAPARTLSFKDNTTAYTDTQFKPKLDVYTIRQVVEGELEDLDDDGTSLGAKSQREEDRILTHDAKGTDKYYIDGALQSYIPALPDPTKTIKITDTAIIGYPDKIDLAKTKCEAWSKVLTQAEIDAL